METADIIEKIEKIKLLYRILILVGVILLFVGVYVWQVHSPKSKQIVKLENSNKKLTQKISEAKQKTSNLAKFEDDMTLVKVQYKEALTLLPKKEEIPSLLRKITELGTTSDLKVNSFTPSTGKKTTMYTEIIAKLSVNGKYHDVLRFFDRVGKMKRIVNIKDVSMSPKKDVRDLGVSCLAITYKFNK